jgi:KDO2-lipid IV(A) lauroyltransferase
MNLTQRRQLEKAYYRHLGDVIVENIKSLTISREEMKRRVQFPDFDEFSRLLEKYPKIITATSHCANWEWMMLGVTVRTDAQSDIIFRPLTNSFFNNLMLKARGRFGAYMIDIRQVTREIARRRKAMRILGLAADQSPGTRADKYWTTWLNQETAFLKGIAVFARLLSTPVVFVETVRTSRGFYRMKIEVLAEPPFDNLTDEQLIELYGRRLEKQIRNNPEQWLWSHKRWKRKRDQELSPIKPEKANPA